MAADPARTQATLIEAVYRVTGRAWPYPFAGAGWSAAEVERVLGAGRGTGRQTLAWASDTIARLLLAAPGATLIDLFEASADVMTEVEIVMTEVEIDRRERMLTGRIDRSDIYPSARMVPTSACHSPRSRSVPAVRSAGTS